MTFVRLLAVLAVTLSLLAYLLSPLADRIFWAWFASDLKLRSQLIFSSIENDLAAAREEQRA